MNYKLAKQLKEAGFPQVSHPPIPPYQDYLDQDVNAKSGLVSNPILSELIEACGDNFNILSKARWKCGKTGWIATKFESEEEMISRKITRDNSEFGKSPEEAVARLYLRLKKMAKVK
ncbi:MAG TPA: hypothetical protein ENH85_00540 [Candidatus Scalindua sp.]|nr:hypothetical protein [Candidatus Scalindua sp.]